MNPLNPKILLPALIILLSGVLFLAAIFTKKQSNLPPSFPATKITQNTVNKEELINNFYQKLSEEGIKSENIKSLDVDIEKKTFNLKLSQDNFNKFISQIPKKFNNFDVLTKLELEQPTTPLRAPQLLYDKKANAALSSDATLEPNLQDKENITNNQSLPSPSESFDSRTPIPGSLTTPPAPSEGSFTGAFSQDQILDSSKQGWKKYRNSKFNLEFEFPDYLTLAKEVIANSFSFYFTNQEQYGEVLTMIICQKDCSFPLLTRDDFNKSIEVALGQKKAKMVALGGGTKLIYFNAPEFQSDKIFFRDGLIQIHSGGNQTNETISLEILRTLNF